MRAIFLGAVIVGLLVGGVVSGVRLIMRDSRSGPADTAVEAPQGSPRATMNEWADAWSRWDLDALHELLTPAARQTYPLSAFRDAYSAFEVETTLVSLEATPQQAGNGVAELAVRASTAYFGDLEYSTTLNLEQTADRWLVDWSPAAIHPELLPGYELRSTIKRPTRGAIYDRNGQPLAITRDVRMLGLNRSLVTDRAALTASLVAFGFTQAQVDAAFEAGGGPQQRVAVGPIPDEKAEQAALELRSIPGVVIYFEAQRSHPLGEAGAHVIGYTREYTAEELEQLQGQGFRVGDRVGAVGLEAALEETLAGKPGGELVLYDASKNPVRTLASSPFVEGQDVATTLDANVLVAAQQRIAGRAGAGVVIDPRTNEVRAIVSSPSFDPDAFERNDVAALNAITASTNAPLSNRATEGVYSAGSVFKLITGAAGMAYGGYNSASTIFCGATWDGVDPPRRNWEGSQGPLTIAQGLMRSCNPVFYEIALTLYNQTPDDAPSSPLSEMARLFGFGKPTGIDVLPEAEGLVPDAAWKRDERGEPWYPGDEVNLGIGQGDLLITPLQLANAYSAFIHGALREPVILAGNEAATVNDIPLTPEQFAHLREGLRLVTGPSGTAAAAFANAGYTNFAGKSGTAEDAGEQQHVLFVAYAPADAPGAVAAVVLDDGDSGSIEAGPIARDMVLAALGQ